MLQAGRLVYHRSVDHVLRFLALAHEIDTDSALADATLVMIQP
jgi:hypothetical protein